MKALFISCVACSLSWLGNPDNSAAALDRALAGKDFAALESAIKEIDPARDSKSVTAVIQLRFKDSDRAVRQRAAYALSQIHLEQAKLAIPYLIDALQDSEPRVRSRVALALAKMGSEARDAIPALVQLTQDSDPRARAGAARALSAIGGEPKVIVPKIAELLKDREAPVRTLAAMGLGQLGRQALDAAPALRTGQAFESDPTARAEMMSALEAIDPTELVIANALSAPEAIRRLWAVSILVERAAEAKHLLGKLSELVTKDEDDRVRAGAAFALGKIGSEAHSAYPHLVAALNDKASRVRTAAALALGLIRPQTTGVGQALAEALKDRDQEAASAAATALGNLGPAAEAGVPLLIELTKSQNLEWRRRAVNVLARIGHHAQAATPVLLDALKDGDAAVRHEAARAFTSAGPQATAHLPALLEALRGDGGDRHVRAWACLSLGQIGPPAAEAVPTLVKTLQDEDRTVQSAASLALGEIGPQALPALVKALEHVDPRVRAGAAQALGGVGVSGKRALKDLRQTLGDEESTVRVAAAIALGRLAGEMQVAQETKALAELEESGKALQASKPHGLARDQDLAWAVAAEQLRTAIRGLHTVERAHALDRLLHHSWFPWLAGVLVYLAVVCSLCFLTLWLRPLLLLRINDVLRRLPYIGLPSPLGGGMLLSLRALFLVGFFNYHRRVLDAWIEKHVESFRDRFQGRRTVKDRNLYVPVPVIVDGKLNPTPGLKELGQAFDKKRGCLLISGEEGSGKTALACQIGLVALSRDSTERLSEHLMLPVLIEHEFDLKVADGKPAFTALTEAVRGQLQALIGESSQLSEELLDHLLRQRRILVIVDHCWEASPEMRAAICPAHADFPAHALVVTSANGDALDDVPRSVVELLRIDGNRLAAFVEAYLVQRGKRMLFNDAEYFDACRRLAVQAGTRAVTVELARQFAEELITGKERAA